MNELIANVVPVTAGGVGSFNLFGYVPSLAAAGVFIALFSLLELLHLAVLFRSRTWWLSIIAIGGVAQIIGWVGRVLASSNPRSMNYFLIQIICLILSPCFFSAACYGILGAMIRILGPQYSRIRPVLYMWIFCIADLIAIVTQAIGGALAALALQKSKDSKAGTHIMLAGICLQMGAMFIFAYLAVETLYRAKKGLGSFNVPGERNNIQRAAIGLAVASFWIIVRCIYRTVELAQGWTGYLITHEGYFIGLDSVPMVLTMAALLYGHPFFCLDTTRRAAALISPLDSPRPSDPSNSEKEIGLEK